MPGAAVVGLGLLSRALAVGDAPSAASLASHLKRYCGWLNDVPE